MNPATQEAVQNIATVVGPAILAFLAGHFHVIFKAPAATPATPGAPALPAAPGSPLLPAQTTVRPIGQGGIIDMLGLAANQVAPAPGAPIAAVGQGGILQLVGLLVQGIISSPGTTQNKSSAVSAVVTATEPFANAAPIAASPTTGS